MAAITSVANLSYGARSVSFTAVAAGADTLAFSVVAAALLAADANNSYSAIYSFLTTSHTDALGTLDALASNGAIVDAIASATGISVFVGGNNSLSVSGASSVSVRISLAASISA